MRAAISLPGNRQGVEDLLDLGHVLVGQRRSLAILDDTLGPDGAGDGDRALATHPANGHLRRRHALTLGNLLHGLDELEILVKDVGLEAWQHVAKVILWEVIEFTYIACQPAAADGAVRHDRNANYMCTILSVDDFLTLCFFQHYVRSWHVSTMPL